MVRWFTLFLLTMSSASGPVAAQTLAEAREGFETRLLRKERHDEPLEPAPQDLFRIVRYPGPAGELTAYLGQPGKPDRKHPAIVWIVGGFPPGGAGPTSWWAPYPDNEQSAQAYRHAGMVMMYPTTLGTYGNPGVQEGFLGEVDDVLAAVEFLRGVPYVDPERIYLGGHSTGGTLALLVAEASDAFRAVFAFGPVADPSAQYEAEHAPYNVNDRREARVRAPIHFLGGLRSPTFVIEGERGNIAALHELREAGRNPALTCIAVKGADHFDVLWPVNALIAGKVAKSGGPISLTADEVQTAFDADRARAREARDLETLAVLRRRGLELGKRQPTYHRVLSYDRAALTRAAEAARKAGFEPGAIETHQEDGEEYLILPLSRLVKLDDLQAVFAAGKAAASLAQEHHLTYQGWDVE